MNAPGGGFPNSNDIDNKGDGLDNHHQGHNMLIKEEENGNIRRNRACSNIIDTARQNNISSEVIIEDIDNENEDERLLL